MKIILKIGRMTEILLPDDKGVATVLKVLSRGIECNDRLYRKVIVVTDQVPVEIKTVPRDVTIKRSDDLYTPNSELDADARGRKPLALPEPKSIIL